MLVLSFVLLRLHGFGGVLVVLLVLGVVGIRVFLERDGANGAGFVQLLVDFGYLSVVVKVVGNEFVGDDEPGAEIALKGDKSEEDGSDADKDDKHFGVVGFSGENLHTKAVVDERQAREEDGEDKGERDAALAADGVGVVYLEGQEQKTLIDPECQTPVEEGREGEVREEEERKQKGLALVAELVDYDALVLAQEEEAEHHVAERAECHVLQIGIQLGQALPQQDHTGRHHERSHLHDHPLR